jgi:hypothetical protein
MLALAMRYLLGFLLPLLVAAGAKPVRYELVLREVKLAPSAPAELAVKARRVFDTVTGQRADVVKPPENGPDPDRDPAAYRKDLEARGVKAYALTVTIDQYERSFGPNPEPGKKGNLLTVKLGLAIVGAQLPGGALALSGSGSATVMADAGATLAPREEEDAGEAALQDAFGHALEQALERLQAPPRPQPRKKK